MYYVKQSGFLLLYNVFMIMIAMVIRMIPNHLMGLELAASIVNIGLYLVIVAMTMHREGTEGKKVLHANDLEREQIILTGKDVKLKKNEEYTPWKGYVIGLIICAPMVLCLIIHGILGLAGGIGLHGAGAVSSTIYMAFFNPVSILFGVEACLATPVAVYWQHLMVLYALPIITFTCGFFYNLGAKKMQKQYDKLEAKHHEIYGD